MPVEVPVVEPDIVIALAPLKAPVYPVKSILLKVYIAFILQAAELLNTRSSVDIGVPIGLQLVARFQRDVVPTQVLVAII
jgi:hypothetical protein